MALIQFPVDLAPMLTVEKVRNSIPNFFSVNPRRGALFSRDISTTAPVVWDATFRYSRADALRFRLWFELYVNSGTEQFAIDIQTEFGMRSYIVRMLAEDILRCQQDGPVFTYTAKLYATELQR